MSEADLIILRDELRTEILHGSFIEDRAAGGVVTYVAAELAAWFETITARVVVEGRDPVGDVLGACW